MGKVFTSKKVATFEVFGLKEIGKIIKVFTEHPRPLFYFLIFRACRGLLEELPTFLVWT